MPQGPGAQPWLTLSALGEIKQSIRPPGSLPWELGPLLLGGFIICVHRPSPIEIGWRWDGPCWPEEACWKLLSEEELSQQVEDRRDFHSLLHKPLPGISAPHHWRGKEGHAVFWVCCAFQSPSKGSGRTWVGVYHQKVYRALEGGNLGTSSSEASWLAPSWEASRFTSQPNCLWKEAAFFKCLNWNPFLRLGSGGAWRIRSEGKPACRSSASLGGRSRDLVNSDPLGQWTDC